MRASLQRDPAARHPAENFAQRFRIRAHALLQLYLARFIQHAIPTVAISQIQSDGKFLPRNIPACAATVLTFFIAGLLYLLCLEHVDNLGAYTASRPEIGLLIPSACNNQV